MMRNNITGRAYHLIFTEMEIQKDNIFQAIGDEQGFISDIALLIATIAAEQDPERRFLACQRLTLLVTRMGNMLAEYHPDEHIDLSKPERRAHYESARDGFVKILLFKAPEMSDDTLGRFGGLASDFIAKFNDLSDRDLQRQAQKLQPGKWGLPE